MANGKILRHFSRDLIDQPHRALCPRIVWLSRRFGNPHETQMDNQRLLHKLWWMPTDQHFGTWTACAKHSGNSRQQYRPDAECVCVCVCGLQSPSWSIAHFTFGLSATTDNQPTTPRNNTRNMINMGASSTFLGCGIIHQSHTSQVTRKCEECIYCVIVVLREAAQRRSSIIVICHYHNQSGQLLVC